MQSVELSESRLAQYDAVILVTAHQAFDYELIARCAKLVVDTRHVLAEHMAGDPRYVRA